MRILVVEDDVELRAALVRRLKARGNGVDAVASGREARAFLDAARYDVVILDRMLPDGDSIVLLKGIRASSDQTPVLLLTAMDQIDDRVEGLEAGADDYLVKPFAMDELLARVSVLARRRAAARPSIVRVADLAVDTGRREVRRSGVLIPLRAKEYSVLELLATRRGLVVSRGEILDSCWDALEGPASNVEQTTIASLRRKLGEPQLIRTVRGAGYMLEVADES